MNRVFLALGLMMMVVLPLQAKAEGTGPMLYAVTFHADWCGSCKVMEPEVTKARARADLNNQNVLFVTLDLTDATTRHQAGLMASALGLDEFYAENAGKTGFILLVNSKTGEHVGKITKDMKANQIEALVQEKIKSL